MHFRKIYTIIALMLFVTLILCGCGGINESSGNKLQILCTNYPLYDWARNITQGTDSVEITLLLKNGVDIHSFQPSAEDIVRITDADLFVYNGGPSEEYLTEIISGSGNVFTAVEVLPESLMASGHFHHDEYDEHIWLSVKNAIKICSELSDKIIELDPENADAYRANTMVYLARLSALDSEFSQLSESSTRKELVLADRYPFVYLMNDYGLICHAAFPGCSDETEASFSTIISLSEKLKELNLSYVLTTDGTNNTVAEAVIASTSSDINILSLNSLQTITEAEINSGKTYLSAMEENLEILRKTLN